MHKRGCNHKMQFMACRLYTAKLHKSYVDCHFRKVKVGIRSWQVKYGIWQRLAGEVWL